MVSAAHPLPDPSRAELRRRLLAARGAFVVTPALEAALGGHLADSLAQLEPERLGVYWPMRSEFNAPAAVRNDPRTAMLPLALPFTRRSPREMHFRTWDGAPPAAVDECRIATSDGATTVPDVVLAPCVGFTAAGFRLGYGGGYFDRWLAAHPHVTAIGVAWSVSRLDEADFRPEPHDQRLRLVVTELGVA